jgi:outer membrane protein insertion porin family
VKSIASTSYFKPIWFDHIISGRVEAGWVVSWSSDPVPLFERFYLGGPNTLRMFKFREVSPVDDTGERTGGTSEVLGNFEYIIPLPYGIRIATFFDVGNVYGFTTPFDITNLRTGVGAGLRWNSPFGPLRIEYGIKLDRKEGEDFGALQFSVGSPF